MLVSVMTGLDRYWRRQASARGMGRPNSRPYVVFSQTATLCRGDCRPARRPPSSVLLGRESAGYLSLRAPSWEGYGVFSGVLAVLAAGGSSDAAHTGPSLRLSRPGFAAMTTTLCRAAPALKTTTPVRFLRNPVGDLAQQLLPICVVIGAGKPRPGSGKRNCRKRGGFKAGQGNPVLVV